MVAPHTLAASWAATVHVVSMMVVRELPAPAHRRDSAERSDGNGSACSSSFSLSGKNDYDPCCDYNSISAMGT
jgi:hypothetical protein